MWKVLLVQTEKLFFIGQDSYLLHNHNMHPMGTNHLPVHFCLVSISASIWASQYELSLREFWGQYELSLREFWRNCMRTINTKLLETAHEFRNFIPVLCGYQNLLQILSGSQPGYIYSHILNRVKKIQNLSFWYITVVLNFFLKFSKNSLYNQQLVALLSCKFFDVPEITSSLILIFPGKKLEQWFFDYEIFKEWEPRVK